MTAAETFQIQIGDGSVVLKNLPVDKVSEAPWNANVMDTDTYKLLLDDMKAQGPNGIDPIHVAQLTPSGGENWIYTIDGAHRLRVAKELGWKEIPVAFHSEILNESQARLFNYRRDAERGQVDPFKLAQTFKWYTDQGVDQQGVAVLFGIDRSTVTKRLGLLKLDPVVQGIAKDQELSVSHLEPLTALEPRLQNAVVKQLRDRGWGYEKGETPSVKAVQAEVKNVKQYDEAIKKFKEILAKAKFPKCPECGKQPRFNRFRPGGFECDSYHTWDPMKGKPPPEKEVWVDKLQKKVPREVARLPAHVKIKETTEDVDAACWGFIKDLFPRIKRIESTDAGIIGQLKDGRRFSVKFSVAGHSYGVNGRFAYECAGDDRVWFSYGAVGKSTPGYAKGLRTRFSGQGLVSSKKVLDRWEEEANKFLSKYGGSKK